jgi:HEPN domain-containing protein
MEALDIEAVESIIIDDNRSVSLDALASEQAASAREIIDAVQYKIKKVMLLQRGAETGKTHTVRVILSELHRFEIHCLVSATTGIAVV